MIDKIFLDIPPLILDQYVDVSACFQAGKRYHPGKRKIDLDQNEPFMEDSNRAQNHRMLPPSYSTSWFQTPSKYTDNYHTLLLLYSYKPTVCKRTGAPSCRPRVDM